MVADTAAVGAVRRAAGDYAGALSDDPGFAAAAAQVATELATNLLHHAHPGGWILVRALPPDGVELIAVDRGPGLRDVAAAVEGRAPSAHGLGCGLAAVRRAATHFDLHTDPDRGTVVLAVVRAGHDRRSAQVPSSRRWAGVSIGIDEACGDGWAVVDEPPGLTVAVVDGLGHGVHASIAADAAIGALAADPADLVGYLTRANVAMRDTRGAVVAVCHLDAGREELRCLSVGNISARLFHGGTHSGIAATNGTVGQRAAPPPTKIVSRPWPAGATLVLWSDGLTSHLDLAPGADLLGHDPAVTAAVLHRDHTRDRDDATVVVLRNPGTP
jgi:anti-sigma regulatory factor (Ser/Thr protein kinase)